MTDLHRNVKILVIDDEPGFRQVLSEELTQEGYDVVTANNGPDALEKIRRDKFHVAVCDINMPEMDGITTLDEIKKLNGDTEVIMMTGHGTVESAVAAMKRGAYDYVQKPFELSEILALIEKAMEKSELRSLLAVYEACRAVFLSIRQEDLLPTLIDQSRKIMRADQVAFFLVGEDGKMRLTSSHGMESPQDKNALLHRVETAFVQGMQRREPLLLNGHDLSNPGVGERSRNASYLAHPLAIQCDVLGVFVAGRTPASGPFSSSDFRSATIVSSIIAQSVHNAKLYQMMESKVLELEQAHRQLENAQERLIQNEKLAGVGQLAAGVAHELNNPLTGILGFTQLLLQDKTLASGHRDDLENIQKQSQRCRQIIQNLLHFSRRKNLQKQVMNVVPLLEQIISMVEYNFTTSGISLIKDFMPDPPSVMADPSQLEQVFVNILTNARHALNGRKGGRIRISVRREGDYLLLAFEDNGCGISQENISKIFDPFFTTKPVGEGTGLGLSLSYGIIEQHQGRLSVKSQ